MTENNFGRINALPSLEQQLENDLESLLKAVNGTSGQPANARGSFNQFANSPSTPSVRGLVDLSGNSSGSIESKPQIDSKATKEQKNQSLAEHFGLSLEELKAILKQLNKIKDIHGIQTSVGELYSKNESVKFGRATSKDGDSEDVKYFIILKGVKKVETKENLRDWTKKDFPIDSNNVNAAYVDENVDGLSKGIEFKVTQTQTLRSVGNEFTLTKNETPKYVNKGSPPQAAGYSLLKQNCLF